MTIRAFQVFVKTLYTMNSFNGEPLIEELILRIGEVKEEMETLTNKSFLVGGRVLSELEEIHKISKTPRHVRNLNIPLGKLVVWAPLFA